MGRGQLQRKGKELFLSCQIIYRRAGNSSDPGRAGGFRGSLKALPCRYDGFYLVPRRANPERRQRARESGRPLRRGGSALGPGGGRRPAARVPGAGTGKAVRSPGVRSVPSPRALRTRPPATRGHISAGLSHQAEPPPLFLQRPADRGSPGKQTRALDAEGGGRGVPPCVPLPPAFRRRRFRLGKGAPRAAGRSGSPHPFCFCRPLRLPAMSRRSSASSSGGGDAGGGFSQWRRPQGQCRHIRVTGAWGAPAALVQLCPAAQHRRPLHRHQGTQRPSQCHPLVRVTPGLQGKRQKLRPLHPGPRGVFTGLMVRS